MPHRGFEGVALNREWRLSNFLLLRNAALIARRLIESGAKSSDYGKESYYMVQVTSGEIVCCDWLKRGPYPPS